MYKLSKVYKFAANRNYPCPPDMLKRWLEQDWVVNMQRKMNSDLQEPHQGKLLKRYKNWARKYGVRVIWESVEIPRI